MKRLLLTSICLIVFSFATHSQTSISKNIFKSKNYLAFIQSHAKEILQDSSSKFVLNMIAQIANQFIYTSDFIYVATLDTIYKNADGYIGEALDEAGEAIFNKNFNSFFNYVFKNRTNKDSKIKDFFIEVGSYVLSEAEDRSGKRIELTKYMMRFARINKYSSQKIMYLKELESKFDETILD